ncbi:MAG: ABC transporter permease subunit [Luteitalea sp.]|nr:ABC transporter permease subunit [Luteitalea sp.]
MKQPSFWQSSLRIADLSLTQMLWSKRTFFMALVVGVPVVIAIGLLLFDLFAPARARPDVMEQGPVIFGFMIWVLYLRFAVPVLAVFYGTALIADEIEDKTITYLFTRPIPRGAVLVGKYLSYLACTLAVVLPSIVVVYLLVAPRGTASLGAAFPDLLKDLALVAAGLAVYGAVFAWMGARLKRPLIIGLVFLFGWEPTVLAIPGYLKQFTVAYYLQGLVPHAMPQDTAVSMLQSLFRETPSLVASVAWLLIIGTLALWLAARTVARREYVLEQ